MINLTAMMTVNGSTYDICVICETKTVMIHFHMTISNLSVSLRIKQAVFVTVPLRLTYVNVLVCDMGPLT